MPERAGTHCEPVPTTDPESLDRTLAALADPLRRSVVAYLAAEERPVSRDELVDHAATAPASDGPGGRDRHGVAVALYHRHLPELEAADLAVYDPEDELVRPTEETLRAVDCLAALSGDVHST